MTALALAARSYRPLVHRPSVERVLLIALSVVAVVLWLIVLPAELADGFA